MDFDLTDEQKILKESARKLMEKEIVPYLDSFQKDKPLEAEAIKKLLKKLIPLGYLGNTIPVEYGGAGLDYLTYGLILEELEPSIYYLVMVTGGTARALYLLGNETQKRTFIPPLVSAEQIGCSAITEPNVGSNASAVNTKAVLKGEHYILNGTKMFITNGSFADIAFVLATVDPSKGNKGLCRFILERAVSPFESRPISTIGDSQVPGVSELVFEDCRVPRENILGSTGEALKETLFGLQIGRCFVAISGISLAQRAIDASVRYAKERTQFGRPIGQFQLIQSMLADMITETDAARLLTYRALSLVQKGARCAKETSIAKLYATEAAVKVSSMAIQIHGAYGLCKDYPVERLFRYARMLTIPEGTTQIQKLIVGREILGMSAFV